MEIGGLVPLSPRESRLPTTMRRACTLAFLLLLGACVPPEKTARREVEAGPRRKFALALNRVDEGLPAERVIELLGPPDDVRTRNDPGGIASADTKEIWCYGTSGHLTTPTLGQVYIDEDDRVQYVFGKGEPPREELFEEDELRRLIAVLDRVPTYDAGSRFNARPLIEAVNRLQPLGKERALAAIAEYLRVSSRLHDEGRDGMFLVLRALFEVPEDPGYMPRMGVGVSGLSAPENPTLLPRFPLTIERDIPFLLVRGYSIFGAPQPPEEHVEYFRKHGELRAGPLVPTDRPLEALEELARSPRWIYPDDERGRHHLAEQLLRLLDTVYRGEPRRSGKLLPYGPESAEERRRILEEVASLEIRWSPSEYRYTFLDGSWLPDESRLYRREYWKPSVEDLDVELAIERRDRRFVRLELRESFRTDGPRIAGALRVSEERGSSPPLAEFTFGGEPGPPFGGTTVQIRGQGVGTNMWNQLVELPEGWSLRTELVLQGEVTPGPSFTP